MSPLMSFIPPMLSSRLTDQRLLADPRYIAEPKLDGQRAQLHIDGGRVVGGRTSGDGALRLVSCAACVYDRKDRRAPWHSAEGWRSDGVANGYTAPPSSHFRRLPPAGRGLSAAPARPDQG